MSARSCLNNGAITTGNVGLVLTSNNGVYSQFLTSNTALVVSNIALGKGVWNIQIAENITFTNAQVSKLQISLNDRNIVPAKLYLAKGLRGVTPDETLNALDSFNDNLVLTFTVPTVLNFFIVATFSSGTIQISNPLITTGKFITATKLA